MSGVSSNRITLNFREATAAIAVLAASPKKPSVMLWGEPGIGKSSLVRGLSTDLMYRTMSCPTDLGAITTSSDLVNTKIEHVLSLFDVDYTQFGEDNNIVPRPLFDIRLVQQSPTDLKGIPVFDTENQEAVWVMTGSFPMSAKDFTRHVVEFTEKCRSFDNLETEETKTKTIIRLDQLIGKIIKGIYEQYAIVFLDEISTAPPMVQAAALQLVLDRQSGMYEIPKDVIIVAAGNRAEDMVGASNLSATMASRMIHLHLTPDMQQWIEDFAIPRGVDSTIIGYIKFSPNSFFDFKPKAMSRSGGESTFPCPRTWDMLSDVIGMADWKAVQASISSRTRNDNLERAMIAGTIGEGHSTGFLAFRKLFNEFPSPKSVLLGHTQSIDWMAHVPQNMGYDDTSGIDTSERRRKAMALGLRLTYFDSLTNVLSQEYKADGQDALDRMFKNYVDFILTKFSDGQNVIDDGEEHLMVIATKLISVIPYPMMKKSYERISLLLEKLNVGGSIGGKSKRFERSIYNRRKG